MRYSNLIAISWLAAGLRFALLAAMVAVGCLPVHSEETPQDDTLGLSEEPPTLLYVSDYFSFVGEDEQGHVAFALDNNRGRDGEAYQAEHFLVLHDENEGWIEVTGNGDYENINAELISIPDSDSFRFEGTPRDGMIIRSPINQVTLRMEPIPELLVRTEDQSLFRMGSAPAVLEWADRTLTGRVIYEYIYKPDFNRLTRTTFGLWKDFQGFYISIDGNGDFYLHSQQSEKFGSLVGKLIGFSVFDGQVDQVKDVELEVLKRKLTWGFYRWPTEWRITWTGKGGSAIMQFRLMDRRVLANWIIGGFAMGIIKGEIVYNGREWPFYGLAELLM